MATKTVIFIEKQRIYPASDIDEKLLHAVFSKYNIDVTISKETR